jgi:hypothetical protein
MRRITMTLLGAALLGLAGCTTLENATHNVSAADCATTEAMQAFINNLPGNPFVNPGQALAIQQQICFAEFGTVAAPPTAPGNNPAIAAPTPTPTATPAAK